MKHRMFNKVREVEKLSAYVRGYAGFSGDENEQLIEAADWLEKLADHMCGQGYIGCEGGEDCNSDHK